MFECLIKAVKLNLTLNEGLFFLKMSKQEVKRQARACKVPRESQNKLAWKGTLEISGPVLISEQGQLRSTCLRPCSVEF